jgi:hypothetical protein
MSVRLRLYGGHRGIVVVGEASSGRQTNAPHAALGGVAERLNATVLKTVRGVSLS